MPLLQIIYMSSFASHDEAQIPAILESARRKNAENGIAGMLLYSNGTFMQVLEGGHEAVRATFETIKKDTRHYNIFTLDELLVGQRQFASWSMGYHRVTGIDLNSQPDLAAVFEVKPRELAQRVAPGIAHAVLGSFVDRSSTL
jgi:Sensors of blue-light using FAD